MNALQAAQSIYDSTIKNLANKEIELDAVTALEVATFCSSLAQAEAMERIAMQLGNIHQALLTPNAEGEPATAADQLSRIADLLEAGMGSGTDYGTEGKGEGQKYSFFRTRN